MTNKTSKISGLIITYNEEKNIDDAIQSLDFADEIIIVDSFSTDNTADIIKKHKDVKLIQNKFSDYTSQRNLAITYASNSWIVFLDADERIPEILKKEIIESVNSTSKNVAYYFYRKFMFLKKPLYFSGWQTDKNIRLFRKENAYYVSHKLVHEKLAVNGPIGKLNTKLIHYSYSNYDNYKNKMVYYGKLKAKELYKKGVKPIFFHFIIKPLYKFLHSYIIRLGILDGKKGLIICYLNALSVYKRYSELKKMYRKI